MDFGGQLRLLLVARISVYLYPAVVRIFPFPCMPGGWVC